MRILAEQLPMMMAKHDVAFINWLDPLLVDH